MIDEERTITIPEGLKYGIDPEGWVVFEKCSVRNKILVGNLLQLYHSRPVRDEILNYHIPNNEHFILTAEGAKRRRGRKDLYQGIPFNGLCHIFRNHVVWENQFKPLSVLAIWDR
jgi:hypothetical protein